MPFLSRDRVLNHWMNIYNMSVNLCCVGGRKVVWSRLLSLGHVTWVRCQSINQSTFVKRRKLRANRRCVKKKARPSGYRMLWQKVPSLKHVWKWSQFWVIDNYMAVSSTLKASWDWKILPTSQDVGVTWWCSLTHSSLTDPLSLRALTATHFNQWLISNLLVLKTCNYLQQGRYVLPGIYLSIC